MILIISRLNSLQWGAVESATTVLQSLVSAHLTCHVLLGVSRSQRLACLCNVMFGYSVGTTGY
jgi:hypothetical protein